MKSTRPGHTKATKSGYALLVGRRRSKGRSTGFGPQEPIVGLVGSLPHFLRKRQEIFIQQRSHQEGTA